MSESKILRQVFDLIEKLSSESDGSTGILVAGVEIDENGFPSVKAIKCSGSPANTIAAVDIMQRMLDETLEEIHERIKQVAEMSSKLSDIEGKIERLGKKLADEQQDSSDAERIRQMIMEFKRQLGKQ